MADQKRPSPAGPRSLAQARNQPNPLLLSYLKELTALAETGDVTQVACVYQVNGSNREQFITGLEAVEDLLKILGMIQVLTISKAIDLLGQSTRET